MKLKLFSRPVVLAVVGLCLIGGVTVAQAPPLEPIQWDKRRLDQLDRNVRRLERALTQRNAQGQPVLVETDPEVVALQGRVGALDRRLQDLESTFQRVNADLERLTFSMDESERDNAALRARLTDSDARIVALETSAKEAAALTAPVVAGSPTGDATQDLTAAVALARTDAARGGRALEAVVLTWPDTPQAREAEYRLGDLRADVGDSAGAVQAYARALSGWPRAAWAGEATLDLATALEGSDRTTQACAALGEFAKRYATGAAPALRTRASQLRTRAECD